MKLPGHDAIARQADEHLVTHRVKLPKKVVERPIRQVVKRLAMALFVLAATAFIVWVDRDGYNDTMRATVSTSSTPSTTRPSPSRPPDTATSPRSATPPD